MNQIFDSYAKYYDLLYRDKNYSSEVEYIISHIQKDTPNAKHILELGCGTGTHAEYLARKGYKVHGVDISEEMLSLANKRKKELPSEIANNLSFELGDARTIRTGKVYDVIISLFHVMSYQVSDSDLINTFDTAHIHLPQDGLFLFDFWYTPSVLSQKPEIRVKKLEDKHVKVIRIAEPVMHDSQNLVDVNFTVFVSEKSSGKIHQLSESHSMRYFSLSDLERHWKNYFKDCSTYGWMTNSPPNTSTWAAFQKLKRI